MFSRQVFSRSLGLGGILLFGAAVWGLGRGVEPFATWFYSFAWWSYILVADALIFARQGRSLLMSRAWELPHLAAASITCWLIFEAANLALGNWHYQGLPQARLWRWLGYGLSFATVFPGLFQTRDLLAALGVFGQVQGPPRPLGAAWLAPATIAGWVMLLLPLLRPRFFFPLIWPAFIFFLEPFCYLGGGRSLWADWRRGQRQEVYLLLMAGLICGFFWELWNFWARARWVYTLPFFDFGRIFEMPILGYLGFPPFALACAVMYNFRVMLAERRLTSARARNIWLAGQFVFWLLMFAALDRWTVLSLARG